MLKRGKILPPVYIIDILLYTCDVNINTKHYSVSKFTIASIWHAKKLGRNLDCTHPATDLRGSHTGF